MKFMSQEKKVAFIGGGPAGLYAAWLLTQNGFACTVFDHKIPWEKPCGGGITSKAFGQFPILDGCAGDMQVIDDFTIISPNDDASELNKDADLHIISRKDLSAFMLHKCLSVGVRHISEKVSSISRADDGILSIQTPADRYNGFQYIVGADGANGVSRQLLGAVPFNKDRMGAMGYYIKGLTDHKVVIKFYKGFKGYLWMFPRQGHASVGVGFPSGSCSKKEVKSMVDQFLSKYYPQFHTDEQSYYAATIPYVTHWKKENLQGKDWALIGDAGGFTDAITGEGIYYAFKTGEIFAKNMICGTPEKYYESTAGIRDELHKAYSLSDRFYKDWVLNLLVKLCRKSSYIRRLSAKLIIGQQSYLTLKDDIKKHKWQIAKECVVNIFKR